MKNLVWLLFLLVGCGSELSAPVSGSAMQVLAPVALQAVVGSAGVQLTWRQPQEGIRPARFDVLRKTGRSAETTASSWISLGQSWEHSFNDPSPAEGFAWYRVAAVAPGGGLGGFSDAVSVEAAAVFPGAGSAARILGSYPAYISGELFEIVFTGFVRPGCSYDGAPAIDCQSPWLVENPVEGLHVVTVTEQGPSVASHSQTVLIEIDRTRPEVQLSTWTELSTLDRTYYRIAVDEDFLYLQCRWAVSGNVIEWDVCGLEGFINTGTIDFFETKAVDRAGNVTRTRIAASGPPQTSSLKVAGGYPAYISTSSHTVWFTAPDDASCSVDGVLANHCSSPWLVVGLAEGRHELTIDSSGEQVSLIVYSDQTAPSGNLSAWQESAGMPVFYSISGNDEVVRSDCRLLSQATVVLDWHSCGSSGWYSADSAMTATEIQVQGFDRSGNTTVFASHILRNGTEGSWSSSVDLHDRSAWVRWWSDSEDLSTQAVTVVVQPEQGMPVRYENATGNQILVSLPECGAVYYISIELGQQTRMHRVEATAGSPAGVVTWKPVAGGVDLLPDGANEILITDSYGLRDFTDPARDEEAFVLIPKRDAGTLSLRTREIGAGNCKGNWTEQKLDLPADIRLVHKQPVLWPPNLTFMSVVKDRNNDQNADVLIGYRDENQLKVELRSGKNGFLMNTLFAQAMLHTGAPLIAVAAQSKLHKDLFMAVVSDGTSVVLGGSGGLLAKFKVDEPLRAPVAEYGRVHWHNQHRALVIGDSLGLNGRGAVWSVPETGETRLWVGDSSHTGLGAALKLYTVGTTTWIAYGARYNDVMNWEWFDPVTDSVGYRYILAGARSLFAVHQIDEVSLLVTENPQGGASGWIYENKKVLPVKDEFLLAGWQGKVLHSGRIKNDSGSEKVWVLQFEQAGAAQYRLLTYKDGRSEVRYLEVPSELAAYTYDLTSGDSVLTAQALGWTGFNGSLGTQDTWSLTGPRISVDNSMVFVDGPDQALSEQQGRISFWPENSSIWMDYDSGVESVTHTVNLNQFCHQNTVLSSRDNWGRSATYAASGVSFKLAGAGSWPGEGIGGLAIVPDRTADGIPEVVIGQPAYNTRTGRVLVQDLAQGTTLLTFAGSATYEYFGNELLHWPDQNADGIEEFVVGAPGAGGAVANGKIRLISGINGALMYSLTGESGDQIGRKMQQVSDINGDGWDELIAGAPYSDTFGPDRGKVQVIDVHGQSVLSVAGGPANISWGYGLQALSGPTTDLTRIYIGGLDTNGVGTGAIYLDSDPVSPLTQQFSHQSGGQRHGIISSTVIPDVDGDGWEDLVLGGRPTDTLENIVAVRSSRTGALLRWQKGQEGDRFGRSLATGADWNGDGIPEIMAGIPGRSAFDGGVMILDGASLSLYGELLGTKGSGSAFGDQIAFRTIEGRSWLAVSDGGYAFSLFYPSLGSARGQVALYEVVDCRER